MHTEHLRAFFQKVFIIFIYAIVLGPFIWCLLISLQSAAEVNSAYALLLPNQFQWQNYWDVLSNGSVYEGLFNSLIISLISVGVNLLVSIPAGFALARIHTPLSRFFLRAVLMFVFVPILLLAEPVQNMLVSWGLRRTPLMAALPLSSMVTSVLLFWSYFSRFPREMDDCGVLLGMTPIHSFFRVYLPVSGRIIIYAALLQFITTWNCSFIPIFMYRISRVFPTVNDSMLQFTLLPSRIYFGMVAAVLCCLPSFLCRLAASLSLKEQERFPAGK